LIEEFHGFRSDTEERLKFFCAVSNVILGALAKLAANFAANRGVLLAMASIMKGGVVDVSQ